MLFSSYIFIFLFLPLVLLGFYKIKNKKYQLVFLFISSLIFYSYWSFKYVFLLLFTVILDFYIAKKISENSDRSKKKALLLVSIITNLSILFLFKYFNFFTGSLNNIYSVLSPGSSQLINNSLSLILPIGISFYTFQSMSYVIDVYRGTSDVHANLLAFASYVTLFPHQISGPLVRHNQIVPQLENEKTYLFNYKNFYTGCCLFILGLSKKILIADQISRVVTPLVNSMGSISNFEAILAMLGYTVQLYFDFSGYSDMAIGLGKMMNIDFPINFNSPYKSKSITEFWQKWHMTLSSWLKDYLYISLGGNRDGRIATYKNLFLTMLIGGLWHGANITFVVWGAFHGTLLVIEKFAEKFIDTPKLNVNFNLKLNQIFAIISKIIKVLFTFIMVNLGWIFFKSDNLNQALIWVKKVLLLQGDLTHSLTWTSLNIITKYKDRFYFSLILGLILIFLSRNTNDLKNTFNTKKYAILLALLFVVSVLFLNEESPFLYFQF